MASKLTDEERAERKRVRNQLQREKRRNDPVLRERHLQYMREYHQLQKRKKALGLPPLPSYQRQLARARERYHNDPEYRFQIKRRSMLRSAEQRAADAQKQRERYHNDPEFRQSRLKRYHGTEERERSDDD